METTQNIRRTNFAFHWNIASTFGLVIVIQSILALFFMLAYLPSANPEFVGLYALSAFQAVFCALGVLLFLDATFLRANSSRLGFVVTGFVLAVVYVILLLVFAFITRNNRLAYIEANPADFNSEAAIATAIAEAHTLCQKQAIFFSLSLPCLIAMIPLSILKALDGEARTPYYVFFVLAMALLFFGVYASVNLLDQLASMSSVYFAQIVETRSIVVYIACLGIVSLNSDFDPDKRPLKK
jgi:hypothetical protein